MGHARQVNVDDQRRRRHRSSVILELTCLLIFLISAAGVVVVIVIGWPWPLLAVLGVIVARVSLEGIFRADPEQIDEPS
jgi:NhaP-type Na+/H+ or K+/H+ antiporter